MTLNWQRLKIGLKKVILRLLSFKIVHNDNHSGIFIGNIYKNLPAQEAGVAERSLKIIEFSAG